MPPERYAKCRCKNCGGHIEFPSSGAGSTVPCPHCNWPTLLEAETVPGSERIGGGPGTRGKVFRIFIVLAILVGAVGAAAYWYWSRTLGLSIVATPASAPPTNYVVTGTNTNATPVVKKRPPPDPWHGLTVGSVTLEKAPGGNLVYAVGKIHNASDRQRFGVKVELEILDNDRQKLGVATDYVNSIDPGKDWTFRALVTDRSAAKARVVSITEN